MISAAEPLGLLATAAPQLPAYQVTVILGGVTTGNRLRAALAHDLLDRGTDLGTIVALTAERVFTANEHLTDPDSKNDRTEWSNLLRYLQEQFGPLHPARAASHGTHPGAWQDHRYTTPEDGHLRLLVSPASRPGRRATTSDAVAFLLSRIPARERRTVLLLTSAIYAPYQFFSAAPPLLRDGTAHIELVGTPTATSTGPSLLAQRLAQEIHAALITSAALRRETLHPH